MKVEIYDDEQVGTAEWQAPGRVALEVEEPDQRRWFESFFATEDSTLDGPVECASMTRAERGDSSEEAFARALYRLGFYAYQFRPATHAKGGAKET
ncbi:MAG: hypothetical protein M3343_07035 [Actinomycetota bacterium]|nr:hypothetical protein [Actinomycetota bacterium]